MKCALKSVFKGLLIGFWICFATAGWTQIPQRSSQLSDDQLLQLYQQARKTGMSDADLASLLMSRGMSAADVKSFQQRLGGLKGAQVSGPLSATVGGQDTIGLHRADSSLLKVQAAPVQQGSRYFGFDFFSSANNSFAPGLNIATPRDYVVGPGDELLVVLSGLNETNFSNKVSPEGFFLIPHAGNIQLNGLTIDETSQKIRASLSRAYPALLSGATQLHVSLGNIRSIRVNIIGEAARPGTLTVSSLAGFFNVLYLTGGPSGNGSLRRIELIRGNRVAETIDFYSFLQKGLLGKNIRLEDGDIIRFPLYQKRIAFGGGVRRPLVFELVQGETLADALDYAGGFTDDAYKSRMSVTRIGEQQRRTVDVQASQFASFIPANGDSVSVGYISSRYENRVIVEGAVNRPGVYELVQGLTLRQLLNEAAGLRVDAFRNRAYIIRWNPFGERQQVSFDAGRVFNGTDQDVRLQNEDSVVVLSRDELSASRSVAIGGAVRYPGTFMYREGMTVQDLVAMAGGFNIDAANNRTQISRIERNLSDTLSNQLITLLTVNVDSALGISGTPVPLRPLDYVYVPQLLNYRAPGAVMVRGEVLYPGDYALDRRDETIQEVLARAGGISPFASLQDVQVWRNGLRLGTNLFSNEQAVRDRFMLLPQDSIYVPRNETYVQVSGFVFNQQLIAYNGPRFLYYISAVGGVRDNGKLGKAYVQYSNGTNRKIHHFLWVRFYPRVLPGSRIVVPEKPVNLSGLFSAAALPGLAAAVAALATAVAIFVK